MTKIDFIAKLAYEADRLYSLGSGIEDKCAWDKLPPEARKSIEDGVIYLTKYPKSPASLIHENWRAHMNDLGWTLAEDGVTDRQAKKHAWLMPFNRVPQNIRVKTYLFQSIVAMAVREIGTQGNVETPKT